MLRLRKKNPEGTALVTILMVIIVCSMLALSVLSLGTSQATFSEKEMKRIHSEIIAMGALHYSMANHFTATASNNINYVVAFENTNYNVNSIRNTAGSGTFGTDQMAIQVTF